MWDNQSPFEVEIYGRQGRSGASGQGVGPPRAEYTLENNGLELARFVLRIAGMHRARHASCHAVSIVTK